MASKKQKLNARTPKEEHLYTIRGGGLQKDDTEI